MKLRVLFCLLLGCSSKIFAIADPNISLILLIQQMQQVQGELSSTQKDIKGQIENGLQKAITGHYNFGREDLSDYASYGQQAYYWDSVLNMSRTGKYGSGMGHTMQSLANQYPIDTKTFNSSDLNKLDQQYYALQAQTALAGRATGQYDFDNIQKQIEYQQKLQEKIEKTQDVKAAIDLQNRLTSENNLIQLQLLRQIAVLNQQQATSSQAQVNDAIKNAKFLKQM